MKKSKILVPAVALLALGVAASTTGTVAWFTTVNATSTENAITGNVTAISGKSSTDTFTVNAVVGEIGSQSNVYLTNDSGKTKLYNQTAGTNVEIIPTGGAAYASAPITITVSYSGTAASASDVLQQWKDLVPSTGIVIDIADATSYTSANGFTETALVNADAAVKGLKFWTTAPAAGTASDWVLSTHKSAALTISEATAQAVVFAGSNGSYTMSTAVSAGTVFVGIQGIDSIIQDGNDSYTFSATPASLD